MKRFVRSAWIGLICAGAALAAPITVHNTGVNSLDVVQPIGSATAFWTLASQPAGAGYALGSTPFRYFNGAYYADNAASGWVSPSVTGSAGAAGTYVYQLTIDLTGLDPSTAVISGTFGTDNDGAIWLNGNAPAATTGFASFGGPTGFTISSGFVAGLNTISVQTNNGGDPTAFRVEFSRAEAQLPNSAIPEPSSLALFTGGAVVLMAGRLRRAARG